MYKKFLALFPAIAIDLGSSEVRVWVSGAQEPVSIASVVALDTRGNLVALGKQAQDLMERTARDLQIITPVELGVVRDESAAKMLVQAAIAQQSELLRWKFPPVMMMTIPVQANRVQQERAQQFLLSLGAREAYLIAQPLAATIGAGVPIADTAGSVVVQLGSGRVEVAALTLGGITNSASCEFGGRSLLEQLRMSLREQYHLEISLSGAETLLHSLVLRTDVEQRVRVTGKDVSGGAPKIITIDGSTLIEGLQQVADRYVSLVIEVLSQVPPAVTGDIVDRGILLSGGLAQLPGLSEYLGNKLQLPCSVVEEPAVAAIKGAHLALSHIGEFKELFANQ